jgi:hypothetical protein
VSAGVSGTHRFPQKRPDSPSKKKKGAKGKEETPGEDSNGRMEGWNEMEGSVRHWYPKPSPVKPKTRHRDVAKPRLGKGRKSKRSSTSSEHSAEPTKLQNDSKKPIRPNTTVINEILQQHEEQALAGTGAYEQPRASRTSEEQEIAIGEHVTLCKLGNGKIAEYNSSAANGVFTTQPKVPERARATTTTRHFTFDNEGKLIPLDGKPVSREAYARILQKVDEAVDQSMAYNRRTGEPTHTLIDAEIEGFKVHVFLDSGATKSMISRDLWKQLWKQIPWVKRVQKVRRMMGLDNHIMTTDGYVDMAIQIAGTPMMQRFEVARNVPYHILIGTDYLRRHLVVGFDYKNGEVFFGAEDVRKTVKMLNVGTIHRMKQMESVACYAEATIPPRSAYFGYGYARTVGNARDVHFQSTDLQGERAKEEGDVLLDEVHVGDSYCHVLQHKFPLTIVNHSEEEVKYDQYTNIGEIYSDNTHAPDKPRASYLDFRKHNKELVSAQFKKQHSHCREDHKSHGIYAMGEAQEAEPRRRRQQPRKNRKWPNGIADGPIHGESVRAQMPLDKGSDSDPYEIRDDARPPTKIQTFAATEAEREEQDPDEPANDDEPPQKGLFESFTMDGQQLRGTPLNDIDKARAVEMLNKHLSCFSKNQFDLGCMKNIQHDIDTGTEKPIYIRPYDMTPVARAGLRKELDGWLKIEKLA